MEIDKLKNDRGVYIIIDRARSEGDNIVYKIGYSNKVKDRVNQIKSAYNFLGQKSDTEVFNVIYCNQARKLERHLHTMLNSFKLLDKHEFFESTLDKLNSKLMLIKLEDYK